MAGTSKPSENLIEASYKFIDGKGSQGSQPTGLFDGTTVNQWNTNKVMYWYLGSDFVELELYQKSNIWRSGTASWSTSSSHLIIKKYNETTSSYENVTDKYPQTTSFITNTQWEKTISNLPSGRYRFEYGGLRIDSEWFIENIEKSKSLIFHDGEYKKFHKNKITTGNAYDVSLDELDMYEAILPELKEEGWIPISSTLPTFAQFTEHGMDSPINLSDFDELIGDFEIVTWTDIGASLLLDIEGTLNPQVIYPTKDINIINVKTIDELKLTGIGNPKVAISFDSGTTWKAHDGAAWVVVTDASSGMDIPTLNALTSDLLKEARRDSNTIRFSYFISDSDKVDDIIMTVTIAGYEKLASTADYSLSYDEGTDTIQFLINKSGTYSVNYGAIT